ncbi:hypothetical protein CSHISOI_10406, partial [Colletotrichum shisoi]
GSETSTLPALSFYTVDGPFSSKRPSTWFPSCSSSLHPGVIKNAHRRGLTHPRRLHLRPLQQQRWRLGGALLHQMSLFVDVRCSDYDQQILKLKIVTFLGR